MTYKKCDENSFCSALLARCQGAWTGSVKGFIKHDFMDMETGKETGSIISYSKGKGDKGLALNFCPFCGFSFYDMYRKGKKVGGGSLILEDTEGEM